MVFDKVSMMGTFGQRNGWLVQTYDAKWREVGALERGNGSLVRTNGCNNMF
jgi:hypothetical protein